LLYNVIFTNQVTGKKPVVAFMRKKTMMKDHRLIVALDVESYRQAAVMVKRLSPYVSVFKVGNILFTQCGPKIIKYIHKRGAKVFLDLKFHDIPNTVSKAAVEATKLGVYMMNVHAFAGKECLTKTAAAVSLEAKRLNIFKPILVAVTVLTSLHEEDLALMGISGKVEDLVVKLAETAKECGFDGVVASPQETRLIKSRLTDNFVVVTPGIRPEWDADKGDQKRVMTPKEAIQAGSDFLVIGRPIMKAHKPVTAVKKILEELQ